MAADWGAGTDSASLCAIAPDTRGSRAAEAARGCGTWVFGRLVGSGCFPSLVVGRPCPGAMVVLRYQEARPHLSFSIAAAGAVEQLYGPEYEVCHELSSGVSRALEKCLRQISLSYS